jgi:hypothetical protein
VDVAGALVAVELGLPELLHDLAAGKTSPARPTSRRSSWNSERVRLTGSPRTVATWRTRSIATGPASIRPPGERRAVELAAAQLGAHAAEQLAHREGLGDVVVGADLEADHLVDLGVLGGEQDDRHRRCASARRGRCRARSAPAS